MKNRLCLYLRIKIKIYFMDADEISKLVDFTENLVHEKTGQHLDTVQKEILKQAFQGNKLNHIRYDGYENSYVQRVLTPNLWKSLSMVTRERVRKKTALQIFRKLYLQQLQEKCSLQIQPPVSVQPELNGAKVTHCTKPDCSDRENRFNGNEDQFPKADNSQDGEPEDNSFNSHSQASQPSSQTFFHQTRSRTEHWYDFINFTKPGGSLLLSIGIVSFTFILSWLANWYGITNYLVGKLPEAQFGYQWALKFNPNSAAAHYNLGTIYEDQHNYKDADAEYSKALSDSSTAASAYNNKAHLYVTQFKNFTAALDLLQKALPLTEDKVVKSDIHKNQGWALLKLGRYAESKAELENAIELVSDRAPAHCLLAQILEHESNKKALAEWKQCLRYASMYNQDEVSWISMARQKIKP